MAAKRAAARKAVKKRAPAKKATKRAPARKAAKRTVRKTVKRAPARKVAKRTTKKRAPAKKVTKKRAPAKEAAKRVTKKRAPAEEAGSGTQGGEAPHDEEGNCPGEEGCNTASDNTYRILQADADPAASDQTGPGDASWQDLRRRRGRVEEAIGIIDRSSSCVASVRRMSVGAPHRGILLRLLRSSHWPCRVRGAVVKTNTFFGRSMVKA